MTTSALMVRVNGEDFPYRVEESCLTCTSPHRLFIEREMLRGIGYASIARALEGLEAPSGGHHPSARAMARHVKNGHLPGPAQARAALLQRRAEAMGTNILEAESFINEVVVADMVLHQGAQRLANGEIKPSVADTLAAARLLREFTHEEDNDIELEALTESVIRFFDLSQKYMSDADFKAFIIETKRDPVLRAIRARQEARTQEAAEVEPIIDVDYTEAG